MYLNLFERFWSKVDIKGSDDCWNFIAGKFPNGYGAFRVGDKQRSAHRCAWEFSNKCSIPKGKMVLHHCDNRSCCNPKHLYLGTQQDNMNDKIRRGRHVAVTNPDKVALSKARFSEEQLKSMRNMIRLGHTQVSVSKLFKLAQSTLWNICRRSRYPCKGGYFVEF